MILFPTLSADRHRQPRLLETKEYRYGASHYNGPEILRSDDRYAIRSLQLIGY